jgi:hypothetical protein
MQQLLIEHFNLKVDEKLITESRKLGGKLILEGVIQRANAKNQNGRVYPKHILERELKKYIEGPIRERRAFGELDHPESQIVNLKNVSHNITDIWWNGDDVYGRIEILDTPSGQIAKAIIEAGCSLGISSRGMGSVQTLGEGTVEVQDDLSMVCFDLVSEPSTQGAFMEQKTGLYENVNHQNSPKYEKINDIISDIICLQSGICCIKK